MNKPSVTENSTLHEVLASLIQGHARVPLPETYFGGPPGDASTPALIRHIQQAIPGSQVQPDLNSIKDSGSLVAETLKGPDPEGVLRKVVFDYLTNNLLDANPENALIVRSPDGGGSWVSTSR